jgi:hypothetical protein
VKNPKYFFGSIALTTGVGLFIFNVFNFTNGAEDTLNFNFVGEVYYYADDTLWMIAIGAMLITVGVLMIRNK